MFQFRLRTLFILVAAVAFLLAQGPIYVRSDSLDLTLQWGERGRAEFASKPHYELSPRLIDAIRIELAIAVCWVGLKFLRRKPAVPQRNDLPESATH